MTDTTTADEPAAFRKNMKVLTARARRLLNFYADCMQADGRPKTAEEARGLGDALYLAARAKEGKA